MQKKEEFLSLFIYEIYLSIAAHLLLSQVDLCQIRRDLCSVLVTRQHSGKLHSPARSIKRWASCYQVHPLCTLDLVTAHPSGCDTTLAVYMGIVMGRSEQVGGSGACLGPRTQMLMTLPTMTARAATASTDPTAISTICHASRCTSGVSRKAMRQLLFRGYP